MKTVFDQLSLVERQCVAGLMGSTDCAEFRNLLRDTPEITDEGRTLGTIAVHCLAYRILYLNKVRQ